MRSGMVGWIGCGALALWASGAAHALTPGSGQWVRETALYGSPDLAEVWVYVPRNPAPALKQGKRALMLSLHACGQTAHDHVIQQKFNWEAVAEQTGMVVVAPTVPKDRSATRVTAGCWDWFGAAHHRQSRDAVPLIKLVEALRARPALAIDPAQVYVTGLSAGGGMAQVLGCTFPDYFAGVGLVAAPALGSSPYDIFGDPQVAVDQVQSACSTMGGLAVQPYFKSQLWSLLAGSMDTIVKPSHAQRNLEGMKRVLGITQSGPGFNESGGGVGQSWLDAAGKVRLSHLAVQGLAHAWPAGASGRNGGSYVSYTHVDYPAYVTRFFFEHNRRIGAWPVVAATPPALAPTAAAGVAPPVGQGVPAAKTTAAPAAAACFEDSNYQHVARGRATQKTGQTYTLGTQQPIGVYHTGTRTRLRQIGPGQYVLDPACR